MSRSSPPLPPLFLLSSSSPSPPQFQFDHIVWVGDLNYRVALPGGNRGEGGGGGDEGGGVLSDGEGGVQCKVCMAVGGCDHIDANGEEVVMVAAKSTSEVAMEKYKAWQEEQNGGGEKKESEAVKEGKEGTDGVRYTKNHVLASQHHITPGIYPLYTLLIAVYAPICTRYT